MPPRSTSSRRNLKGSSFLLQNEEILNEIRQPLTPPAVHPHNLGQELEAIRSHQRAHDDLLRDLTHQIAQTNVTVFRQKVAENFTNLKEGFTLIQKERRVEKESLSQHKKDTGRQIKEFQGDFLEFAQILKRFEGRLQDMQAQALRRELKQQSQIAVLKQVLKRSGVYNHFLMGEHGAPAAVQSKAAAALQHGSSPAEIEALLQKQAALFDQKLQQLDEKLVQNEQITHQLIEQRTTLHTQQTAQISERTALRLDHFEEDLQRSERGLQQVRDDWLAKVDAVQAQQRFLQETQGQVNLNVEAESQRFAAFMSSARLHAEQTTHDLKAVKERVALVQTQKEEAECHFQQFKMEYQQFIQQSKIQSYYVRVDDISDNQEKILLKLESQEAVSTMLGDKYKECFDEIQSVLMSTKQSNFEASQIVSRQVQQYQEMRLRLADHIERVNVQSMNDLIQKKVELDTIQFQGTLNKLAGHLRDLDERLTGQETMIVHGQNHTAELIQTIVNQPTSLEELEDYHAVPMDDFSQIEPMRQVGKPKAGKKVKLDSNRQLMLQQQLFRKTKDEVQLILDEVSKLKVRLSKAGERHDKFAERTNTTLQELTDQTRQSLQKADQLSIVDDQAEEQLNLVKASINTFQQSFRQELQSLNQVQTKFRVIETSQREIIERFSDFTGKLVDQERLFQLKQEEAMIQSTNQLQTIGDASDTHTAQLETIGSKLTKYSEITENLFLHKSNFTQTIDKVVSKQDHLEEEQISIRHSISSLIDSTTKLRLEATCDQGKVENVSQEIAIMRGNGEKQKQFIYRLQDETVTQERKLGVLRCGLAEMQHSLDKFSSQFKQEQVLQETIAIADNITDVQSLALQDLRSQFKGVKESIYGQ
ncbi:hypothetical protein SS50377_24874 [Spironucleus salmonicida]|uniref:Uncharacterized protein n=1 Tax=Spironucleus salmonicida TaxID=348837 RepID=A0A9P8LRB1_9EUKA|nr:hypothetical protein SS50377_24869 [Spironucleus salmonicida]KAH0572761.1 hypothetical protein SS50377_24874 [Spironucleus salmonicida]